MLVGEEGSSCWLLFKADDGRVACGLLEDPGGRLGIGWYRCSTNPAQMSEAAEDILHRSTDDIQMRLAVTTVGKSEILWQRPEEGATAGCFWDDSSIKSTNEKESQPYHG